MKRILDWVKNNKLEFGILLFVLLLGAYFRFYQIRGSVTFLGDEGRDAIIVKRMIVDHKFTLLGPTISFGNLYLGPIYYYFMIPALWLSNFDPVGPAIMVACFGIATIFLVWKVGRDMFNYKVGLMAAALYSVSALIIIHTRSSWNPNPMPFFSILTIYGLFRTIRDKDGRWLVLVGACLGIAIQLHYIAMVLIATSGLIFLIYRPKIKIGWILAGIASFLVLFSPLIFFELRHGFINTKALFNLFLKKDEFSASAGIGFNKFMPITIYDRLFTGFIANRNAVVGTVLSIASVISLLFFRIKRKTGDNLGINILILWVVFGIIGIPLYQGTMNDHYLGLLFPAPFLLVGYLISQVLKVKNGKIIGGTIFILLFLFNFLGNDIFSKNGPNYQIDRVKAVSKTIADNVGDKKFNVALVSPTKDFMAYNYRYFLELDGKVPQNYDNFNNIDVLYVIEEYKWASPDQLGIWEVGTFGPSMVIKDWTFDFGVQVYRLDRKTK